MQLTKLNTKFLGRNLIYYNTIDSTQLEAWRLIEKGSVNTGTTIISDLQTNGKRDAREKMAYRPKE